jgi:hypothetical protein
VFNMAAIDSIGGNQRSVTPGAGRSQPEATAPPPSPHEHRTASYPEMVQTLARLAPELTRLAQLVKEAGARSASADPRRA